MLIATLSDESVEHGLGSKTANEAWVNLQNRYASVSKARVNTLKIKFQTMKKGGSYVDQYLSRLRNIKDQLIAAGEDFSDNDFIVAVLSGLPREYYVIRIVIFTRDTTMSLREFREQLLCAEREAESVVNNLTSNLTGLYMQGSNGLSSQVSMTQWSSSNSEDVPYTIGGVITQIPRGGSTFGGPYTQGSSSSNSGHVQ
ncbi:hypothetical protein C1H46_036855 [Malus baccata]|uniref:Retrotransposon gag domain-containing protein n=1 Tax=Malus baccata TaxID=106549 RepID=A0A540KTV0_MALBA|nr:hypothetical protein C1H46_036855 [Malus baccata]